MAIRRAESTRPASREWAARPIAAAAAGLLAALAALAREAAAAGAATATGAALSSPPATRPMGLAAERSAWRAAKTPTCGDVASASKEATPTACSAARGGSCFASSATRAFSNPFVADLFVLPACLSAAGMSNALATARRSLDFEGDSGAQVGVACVRRGCGDIPAAVGFSSAPAAAATLIMIIHCRRLSPPLCLMARAGGAPLHGLGSRLRAGFL
mmetsp:Transcript_26174/g.81956  ORF Transcript_26174/g.81956 Transcript_26174/m.81956 type:complete len:216 (+) Transcript_26174:394-1041(+)